MGLVHLLSDLYAWTVTVFAALVLLAVWTARRDAIVQDLKNLLRHILRWRPKG